MLLGNYSVYLKSTGRRFGGNATTPYAAARANFSTSGSIRGRYYQANSFSELSGLPDGYRPPSSWMIPQAGGALGSTNNLQGEGDLTASGALGLNAESDLSGTGDITNAALGLILSAVAALSGSGDLTADILGKLEAVADLVGAGDVTAALGALAFLVGDITGTGEISSANATAKAGISCDITVSGDLVTAESCANAVWSALAAAFSDPGTMGELLNAAGGGSSPEIIADVILRRSTANVEASGSGDALSLKSLYGMISQGVHNTQVSGSTLTVTQSDDTTVLGTRTVTTSPTAEPITGIDSD